MKTALILTATLGISCAALAQTYDENIVYEPINPYADRELWEQNQKEEAEKDLQFFTDWFVALASIDSQSSYPVDGGDAFPLNPGQREIARFLEANLKAAYGLQIHQGKMTVTRSDTEYVYVYIPANDSTKTTSLMLMAHLDVTPEAPGGKITPCVVNNYECTDIVYPTGLTLSPYEKRFERLLDCRGGRIITSDGSTLLGADDKSGCTVMIGVLDKLMKDENISHGDIYLVFSQNEDIGMAADGFDLSYVGGKSPDMVIDIDGDSPHNFSTENFTAVGLKYTFKGNNVHPGKGKADGYADALAATTAFMGKMSPSAHPGSTDGKEGYVHCFSLTNPKDSLGNEIETEWIVNIRLRYFDKAEGDSLRQMIKDAEAYARASYPLVEIVAAPEVMQYENIAYTMHPDLPRIIQRADDNNHNLRGRCPYAERGGTTSAMMAAKGLNGGPCIYSGQQAEHSCYEWVCVEDMIGMSYVVLDIISNIR